MSTPKVKRIVFESDMLPGVFYDENGMACNKDGKPLTWNPFRSIEKRIFTGVVKFNPKYPSYLSTKTKAKKKLSTRHERAIRKALKAFEPMVPPHTMTALEKVIEKHLVAVRKFNEKSRK